MDETIILPGRALTQPRPHHNPPGDCGACCLGGLFGLSVPEVYAQLNEGRVQGFSWPGMRSALHRARSLGLVTRISTEPPMWPVYDAHRAFGQLGSAQALGWQQLAWMALGAGFYGLAEVDFAGRGPGHLPDHTVLLCGIRELWPAPGEQGAIHTEVLVSCSARHPEGKWVGVHDFLSKYGGFHALWARPV